MQTSDANEVDGIVRAEGFDIAETKDDQSERKQSEAEENPIELPPALPTILDISATSDQIIAPPDTEVVARDPGAIVPTGPRALTAHLTAPSRRSPARSTSHQWLSAKEIETDRFLTVMATLAKTAPHSPFVPSTLHEWLAHRLAWLEDQKQAALARLALISQDPASRRSQPALGGRSFADNRSAVLALETIWSPWGTDRAPAPWPTISEFKWEGDARARSGFRRFPPIPRAVGNETVAWHKKQAAEVYQFDRVGQASRMPPGESESITGEEFARLMLVEELLLSLEKRD